MSDQSSASLAARRLFWLRVFLGFSAIAWGVSWVGVFVSWSAAVSMLQGLGAQSIEYDPMMDYWLRMASGAFGVVGCWYLVLALWPHRFAVAVPWFGILMVVEGVVLLVHGLRLGLGPFPFSGDVAACFAGGIGILVCARGLNRKAQTPSSSCGDDQCLPHE